MTLPLLISVPHAGLRVPPEARPYCSLTPEEIARDGDEGAAEIYTIENEVECYVTTDVARAIVDLNRAEDDRRKDGVVKTHTCWEVPVYEPFPPEEVVRTLLAQYYRPTTSASPGSATAGCSLPSTAIPWRQRVLLSVRTRALNGPGCASATRTEPAPGSGWTRSGRVSRSVSVPM